MLVFMEHSVSPKSSPTFSQILKAEEASAGTASQTEVTYFSVPAWFALPATVASAGENEEG